MDMQPLVLPNAKEKVEEATWLENWIRIIAIGYSFWDGFIDCFIIHLAMYLRNCEDPFALHWLLLLCRSLYSRPFFSMVTNVIPVGSVHCRRERRRLRSPARWRSFSPSATMCPSTSSSCCVSRRFPSFLL